MSTINKEERKEMFYLRTHSTHFIYGYMASDIWYKTIQMGREEMRNSSTINKKYVECVYIVEF